MKQASDYDSMIGFAPEAAPREDLETLTLDSDAAALFLDFDGTLVDIAPTPDSIRFGPEDAELLDALYRRHASAVAVVSGRDLRDLDRYLDDFAGTVSGGHGAELRHGKTEMPGVDCDLERLARIKDAVRAFAGAEPRVIAEDKSFGIVLHFRQHPQLEGKVRDFLSDLVDDDGDFGLQSAKMAIEIKQRGISKADAIERIMRFEEFEGRGMVFAGDDETDEVAFRWIDERGGVTIKIGDGPTRARYRTPTPSAFKDWLRVQPGGTRA